MTQSVGIDILRGYELSWLGTKGKPEIACFELSTNIDATKNIDTQNFKKYLENLTSQKFTNITQLEQQISTYLKGIITTNPFEIKFYRPSDFKEQDLTLKSTAQDYFISHNVRFNCQYSGQPYSGSVLVDFIGSGNFSNVLEQKILNMRNNEANPHTYVNALLTADSIVSLHLARKGGISWQLVRSLDPEANLLPYIHRATVE